jgi:streptogramin lyase
MTPADRPTTLTADQLAQSLADLAGTSRPDYRDDLFGRTARTRQRPAWAFIERWLPMTFVTTRHLTAPPLRAAWTLLLIAALTAALVAGLAIAGALVLRQDRPDQLNGLVPTLVRDEGWDGVGLAVLSVPMGLDVGPDGSIYIANTGSNEIVVLEPSGNEVRRWGGTGDGEGQFIFQRDPSSLLDALGGVAVSADGIVYVTDTANDRVQAFTADGGFLGAWGGHGAQDGRFLEPVDVAVGPDGTVFVADDLRDDIQRFSGDGVWIETIGRHGSADGEMDFTSGIAVDHSGVLLNADFGNQRVQAWDTDGTFLWSKGDSADPMGLRNPTDVAVDAEGRVIVADEAGIKVFADGPQAVSSHGLTLSPGPSVAVGAGDVVYVSAPGQDRIIRMRITLEESETSAESAIVSPEADDTTSTAVAQPSPAPGGPETLVTDTVFEIPFSVTLPSTLPMPSGHPGWWRQELLPGVVSFQYVRDGESTPGYVTLYLVDGVYADPCHPEEGLATSAEPTVDELVEALTQQVGIRATQPTDIVLGDHRGLTFDLANSIDTRSCADTTWLSQWTYHAGGSESDEVTNSQGLPNSHQRIAVVDVDGTPVLIESWEIGANRNEVLQADSLFESIRFE